MRGGVDRGHLQRHQRVCPAVNGMAYHAVHVAVMHQSAGVAVIGAEHKVTRIQTLFGDCSDLGFHIIPSRAKPQHRPHPLAHPHYGIRFTGALMVICRPTGGISMKSAQIRAGIMSAHSFARVLRGRNNRQHLGVGVHHTGEVHHLPQSDDVGPLHRLHHIGG